MDKIFTLLDFGPSLVVCYRRFDEVSGQSSRDKQSKTARR